MSENYETGRTLADKGMSGASCTRVNGYAGTISAVPRVATTYGDEWTYEAMCAEMEENAVVAYEWDKRVRAATGAASVWGESAPPAHCAAEGFGYIAEEIANGPGRRSSEASAFLDAFAQARAEESSSAGVVLQESAPGGYTLGALRDAGWSAEEISGYLGARSGA